MPRFTGKTYGRKAKATDSTKTFDEIINEGKLSTSKASSTIKKWGSTSFTSTRAGGEEECVRKRKLEEVDPESLCEDPFSFDSEDDGPTRPKRGMGFKVGDEEKAAKHKSHSNKLRKDENNDEKDTMKRAPTKTYSRGSRLGKSDVKNYASPKSKQLSMDKFATKLGSGSNANKVFHLTLKGNNKQCRSSSPTPKKFFTSSQPPTRDASDKVSGASDKGSELFESASEFEYDSEELANIESGDPEIIFNSPQKRRREEELGKRVSSTDGLDISNEDTGRVKRSLGGQWSATLPPDMCDDEEDEELDKTITNSTNNTQKNKPHNDFSHLFSMTEKRLGRTNDKDTQSVSDAEDNQEELQESCNSAAAAAAAAGPVDNDQLSCSSSDEDRGGGNVKSRKRDFSHLFSETEKHLKGKGDTDLCTDSDGQCGTNGSRYNNSRVKTVKILKPAFSSEGVGQKSKENLSHLFKGTEKQLQREKMAEEEDDKSPSPKTADLANVCDETRPKSRLKTEVSNLFSQTEKRLGQSMKGVFSESEDEEEEGASNSVKGGDMINNTCMPSENVQKKFEVQPQVKGQRGRPKSQANKGDKVKGNKRRGGGGGSKSTRLFEDSDHGSDTDDLSSLQKSPVRMMKRGGGGSGFKASGHSASLGDKPLSSLLLPELRRSGSVESNSSNGSGDRLKRSSSLLSRIQSMDVGKDSKKGKQPIVRRLLTSPKKEGKKFKALYNPRQWREDQEDNQTDSQTTSGSAPFDDIDADTGVKVNRPTNLRHVTKAPANPYDDEVSALKVHKDHKELFTVVTHVKQAHECLEHGETQDFNDELDYIMDGLAQNQPLPVRCLSCLNLAMKCTLPSFRMHLRAHGTLDKVFSAVSDAYQSPPLALVSASILYLVSRDRFSMDLERSTLTLMLRLLSVDSEEQSPTKNNALNREYDQQHEKIRQLFESCKKDRDGGGSRASAYKVDPETITTGHLTMESLLSLTSKKAGDWFKEELRMLGGLDHIIKTVSDCTDDLSEAMIEPSESSLDQLSKVERCLRVLENVTYMNPENQNYLVSHKSCLLVSSLFRTIRICETCLTFNNLEEVGGKVNKECAGYIVFNTLLAVIKVMLNLTHDNTYTSTKVGQQGGLMKKVLFCLLRLPQYIPSEQGFDLLVLSLGLLINLVEHCEHNREILISSSAVCPYDETSPISKLGGSMPSLEALTKLFVLRYEAAKRIEVEHDAELDERERLQQERMERAGKVHAVEDGVTNSGNKSGEWKHSASGMEWVVIEENEEEQLERELAAASDSDLDVEVVQNSQQDEEEHFTKALHRAGRHMEDCILAAYVALVLGCTIQGNMDHIDRVRDCLPEGDFEPMVRMLRKFLGFMNFTATSTVSQSSGSKSITRIIEVLEAC